MVDLKDVTAKLYIDLATTLLKPNKVYIEDIWINGFRSIIEQKLTKIEISYLYDRLYKHKKISTLMEDYNLSTESRLKMEGMILRKLKGTETYWYCPRMYEKVQDLSKTNAMLTDEIKQLKVRLNNYRKEHYDYTPKSIDMLDISNRAKNALKAYGIENVNQLRRTDLSELEEIPSLGKKSIAEIRHAAYVEKLVVNWAKNMYEE